jgi:hypothetical protein
MTAQAANLYRLAQEALHVPAFSAAGASGGAAAPSPGAGRGAASAGRASGRLRIKTHAMMRLGRTRARFWGPNGWPHSDPARG